MWMIGSRALASHGIQNRVPSDFDVMCTPEEVEILRNHFSKEPFINFRMTESAKYPGKYTIRCIQKHDKAITYGISIEIDATGNASRLLMCNPTAEGIFSHESNWFGLTFKVPNLYALYIFKRSHANYPVHIEKTISDLVFLQKNIFTDRFRPYAEPWYWSEDLKLLSGCLKEEAKERNKARDARISFKKRNEEFFNSRVDREFDHDTLHKLTSRYEIPIYEQHIAIPGHALIDMDSFFTMSFENQVTMVQEEAVVIGMERYWQFDKSMREGVVFQKGLYKLLSDLCKGRFQDFALDNIAHIVRPRWDFMETFKERYGQEPPQALEKAL